MKDDFEDRLASVPLREIPAEWKARILRKADAVSRVPVVSWQERLAAWLWPSPWAWGTVAAVWVLIAGLSFSGPRGEDLYAVTPKGMTPTNFSVEQYIAYVAEWRRIVKEERRMDETLEVIDRRRL